MARSKSWTVKGVDENARDAASRAAKAADRPIGVWVDELILGAHVPRAAAAGDAAPADDPASEADLGAILESLEARVADHNARIFAQLEPVQNSIVAMERRLHELEKAVVDAADATARGTHAPSLPEPETDTGAADIAREADDGNVASMAAFADASDAAGDESNGDGFEPDAPTDSDLESADHVVRSELAALLDDGPRSGLPDEAAGQTGYPPFAEETKRSRPVYLLLIAGLLIATAIAIVVFVWLELATPVMPAATGAPDRDTTAPASTPASVPASVPPTASVSPPAPPTRPETPAEAPEDAFARLPLPELSTPPVEAAAPANASPNREGGDTPEIAALRAQAAAGDRTAQSALASRYLVGRGVPLDYGAAAKWLREAAAQGLVSAQYNLGVLYDSGRGVEADPVEALIWFHSAAGKGHGGAQYALAAAYAAGRGIARDPDEALRWLRRGANSNVREAQSSLANILATTPVARDSLTEAYYWYRIADANGDSRAGDRADQVAARLTPEERAKVNRDVSDFIAKNIARAPKPVAPIPAAAPRTAPEPAAADRPASIPPVRDQIVQIQTLLTTLGFRPGTPDGAVGPQTRDAIREYQRELGLPADGEPTLELLAHMRQIAGIGG